MDFNSDVQHLKSTSPCFVRQTFTESQPGLSITGFFPVVMHIIYVKSTAFHGYDTVLEMDSNMECAYVFFA